MRAMPHGAPRPSSRGPGNGEPTPYVELDRAAWAELGEQVQQPLSNEEITRLRFRLRWRGFRIIVDADHDLVEYTLRRDDDDTGTGTLTIRHAGADLELSTESTATVRLVPRPPMLPTPRHPPGRTPLRRMR